VANATRWFEAPRVHQLSWGCDLSWNAFLDAIDQAKDDLKCSKSGAWFRGVTNYRHRLYPSLFRPNQKVSRGYEKAIYEEYTDFSDSEFVESSSWDRIVRLQHFGTPTRLLDWTETFGVALYFATRPFNGSDPPCPAIWIMNPFKISELARGDSSNKTIADFHRDSLHDYYNCFFREKNWPFKKPIPFRPPKLTPRIRAQRGFFTVHGEDPRPLDAIYRGHVRQVRLKSDHLKEARRFLEMSGIDSLSLFPDLEGFSRRIQERYQS